MASTIFESIKESLVGLFKGLYPAFDVFCEEIPKTRHDAPEPDIEDYIFLDIVPAANTTASAYHTDRRVLVDAALHTASESNGEYLRMGQEVDGAVPQPCPRRRLHLRWRPHRGPALRVLHQAV